MRSSETAAWHAATAACLIVIWSVAGKKLRSFWIGGAAVLGLLLAVVLTGRRKTLGEFILFLIVFVFLLARSRTGASRLLRVGGSIAFAATAIIVLLGGNEKSNSWNPYFERSLSVVADAPERLQLMAFGNLVGTVRENGFFGRGAGTGAQGAQYFGGGSNIVGLSAEGGLGRIAAELGVPGIAVVLWLVVALGFRLWRLAKVFPRVAPGQSIRFLGLVALLPANGIVFLAAHQVFGDPFILIVLGLIASSALAFPQIVANQHRVAARSDVRQFESAQPAPYPA